MGKYSGKFEKTEIIQFKMGDDVHYITQKSLGRLGHLQQANDDELSKISQSYCPTLTEQRMQISCARQCSITIKLFKTFLDLVID